MSEQKETKKLTEALFTTEWINYLLFLCGIALLYIYLTHRTDNIVRDIEKSKRELVELRAENITLKAEIIKQRSRTNLEQRLQDREIKEPNRPVIKIEVPEDEY